MGYPILWVPASSEDYARGRAVGPIIAIVHHRMVGTLPGTDATFQSTTNRAVSTHFGIGYEGGRLEIHQYVDLSDTAFGNGNYDSSGAWDNWGYPVSGINARTVSIEHQDNAQLPLGAGKGIVTEAIQKASLWLDSLLLSGDIARMRAAGIRIRSTTTAAQLGRIVPGPRTLITHNDIAGRLKPYCWKPWSDDKVGYPRSRYVAALTGGSIPLPDTSTEDPVQQFNVYTSPREVTIPTGTWLYDNEGLNPSAGNIQVSPGRVMPYVGSLSATVGIVGYIPSSDVPSYTKTYFVNRSVITGYPLIEGPTAPDTTPYDQPDIDAAVKAATDPLKATISTLNGKVTTLTKAVNDLKAQVATLTGERDAALVARTAAEAAKAVAEQTAAKAIALREALKVFLA